jgi:hypothetical protein
MSPPQLENHVDMEELERALSDDEASQSQSRRSADLNA